MERPSIYNLAVLGEDFIRRMKRELPPLTFATSIMCKRITIAYDGFYGAMREDVNLYTAPDTSRLNLQGITDLTTGKPFDDDCRNDADVDPEAPLMCAFDVNDNINWMVVGQLGNDGKLRILKSFYVKYERKLEALCDDFCEYYKYHKKKALVFFFDHTFVGNGYGISQNKDFYSFISNEISNHGWLVDEVYIGRALAHDVKCQIINRMFIGRADHMVLFNRDNNEALLLSIETAGVYMNKKDKRAEKEAETEEDKLEYRTDGSDAFDTLCIGVELHMQDVTINVDSGFVSYMG